MYSTLWVTTFSVPSAYVQLFMFLPNSCIITSNKYVINHVMYLVLRSEWLSSVSCPSWKQYTQLTVNLNPLKYLAPLVIVLRSM